MNMFRIRPPEPQDEAALVTLSLHFASESDWSSTVPIGQIDTLEKARLRLFGEQALAVVVAEAAQGELIGYMGIYRGEPNPYASILVHKAHRLRGLGRALVEQAFEKLPPGLTVEAWVGAFNHLSLAATPRLGFHWDHSIEVDGRTLNVFVRHSE